MLQPHLLSSVWIQEKEAFSDHITGVSFMEIEGEGANLLSLEPEREAKLST